MKRTSPTRDAETITPTESALFWRKEFEEEAGAAVADAEGEEELSAEDDAELGKGMEVSEGIGFGVLVVIEKVLAGPDDKAESDEEVAEDDGVSAVGVDEAAFELALFRDERSNL